MVLHLSPIEEHFIKKELLRTEIAVEFDKLSPEFNDISGLRRFGSPFVPLDPQMVHKMGIDINELHIIGESTKNVVRGEFPVLRFILENFVQTFPFIKIHLLKLGPNWIDQSPFWLKIQTLFEKWKGKKISNSNDRGSISKRELTLSKFKSLILMLFNTGVRTSNEDEYFELDKRSKGGYKKLGKLMSKAEQEKLNQLDINSSELEIEEVASLISLNPDPIDDDEYINGWYVNVIGVTTETELKKGMIWGTRESQYYSFIIRVKRKDNEEGWYIKRRYSDFKQLAVQLKHLYPNVKRPYLPSKDKHTGSMSQTEDLEVDNIHDEIEISNLIDENAILESEILDSKPMSNGSSSSIFKLKSPKTPNLGTFSIGKLERSFKNTLKVPLKANGNHHRTLSNESQISNELTTDLPRENLRLALRGYIKSVSKKVALAKSPELKLFLCNSPMILKPEETHDIQNRLKLDHLTTLQHLKFQKALVKSVSELEVEVLKMKDELYEKGFHYLFDEMKNNEKIDDLSPPIKAVIEVVEIEIASTIYEIFIGSDSSPESYRMIKRLHKLMPYKMMTTILRFTNPLQMVKKMIDLFTFQPFGKGRSLLQIVFMGALSDDVKKYDEELKVLKSRFDSLGLKEIYERIDEYFISDDDIVLKVKEISKQTGLELCVSILIPGNGLDSKTVDETTLIGILKDFKNGIRRDDSIYTLCVRYFQRKLRRWDKEMMRELWEANELMDVIKDLLSIFFEPLIDLFKKAEVFKYVPVFQKFMNELITLCDGYIYDNGNINRGDIVVSLIALEDKYSPYVYKFMRDIYMSDIEADVEVRLFDGMIDWMNRFLEFIGNGKSTMGRLDMAAILSQLDETQEKKVREEIGIIVKRVANKRELYLEIGDNDKEDSKRGGGVLGGNWDKIHDRVFNIGAVVGLDAIDLEEEDDESDVETLAKPLIEKYTELQMSEFLQDLQAESPVLSSIDPWGEIVETLRFKEGLSNSLYPTDK